MWLAPAHIYHMTEACIYPSPTCSDTCRATCTCIVTVCNNTLLHAFNFVGRYIYIYIYVINLNITYVFVMRIYFKNNFVGLLILHLQLIERQVYSVGRVCPGQSFFSCVINIILLGYVCCTRLIRTGITVCSASFQLLLPEVDISKLRP